MWSRRVLFSIVFSYPQDALISKKELILCTLLIILSHECIAISVLFFHMKQKLRRHGSFPNGTVRKEWCVLHMHFWMVQEPEFCWWLTHVIYIAADSYMYIEVNWNGNYRLSVLWRSTPYNFTRNTMFWRYNCSFC